MKRIIILLAVAVVCCTACRYKEGPGISFVAPEYRMMGNWNLEKVFLNGEQITETPYLANVPNTYYIFDLDGVVDVRCYYNNAVQSAVYGRWGFKDNCKILVMDFQLKTQKYYYEASIKKLTKKELIYEYDDIHGDHWRLELICLSRVN
jgi:hypothetical protein